MGTETANWTRRHFLGTGACAAAAAAAPPLRALPCEQPRYAVAACVAHGFAGLRCFRIQQHAWRAAHAVSLPAAAHLAAHPSLPVVYACHDVAEHGHLPRGAVSAWAVDGDGALRCLGTEPLSPGATHPHAALAVAGGSALLVLTRAGIYNVLPIAADGTLGPVSAIRKEHGGGTGKVAAPRHAVEHPDGSLFIVDSGQEVVSRFGLEPGTIALRQRTSVHAGAGAQQMVLSRCGQRAYTLHADGSSIAVHRVTPEGLLPAQLVLPGDPGEGQMLLHPHRPALLRADASCLAAIALDPAEGTPGLVAASLPLALRHVALLPGTAHLVGVHRATAEVVTVPLSDRARVFGDACVVSHVPGCRGLAFPATGRASA